MIWKILSFFVGIAFIGVIVRIIFGFAKFTVGCKIGSFVISALLLIGFIFIIRKILAG